MATNTPPPPFRYAGIHMHGPTNTVRPFRKKTKQTEFAQILAHLKNKMNPTFKLQQ